jgi:hypothetical protein
MSADDRAQTNEPVKQEDQLPVEDLKTKPVDADAAKDVKGGGGIEVTDYGFGVSRPVSTS